MLAIAAVKLGARSAVGIDIDPDALDNARENAGLNQMGDRVRFEEGDFREMAVGADVVMANLTGGLLERSAEALAAMVAPDGFLIVSGFMDSEKAAVVPALETFLTLRTSRRKRNGCARSSRSRLEGRHYFTSRLNSSAQFKTTCIVVTGLSVTGPGFTRRNRFPSADTSQLRSGSVVSYS